MGIEYESVVDHPLAEVFAWHTRPGAMRRLVPPWQPMTVVAEAESLADGRAVLGLPGGLRWVAQHDPDALRPAAPLRRRAVVARSAVLAAAAGRPVDAHPRVRRGARRRHPGPRPRSTPRCPPRRCVRRSSTGIANSPTTSPRTATPPTPICDRSVVARHRRIGSGRIGADGVPEHRRASGDPAGAASGAEHGRAAMGSRSARRPICCPGSTPSCTWRARRSPGGSPRRTRPRSGQPYRADPSARPGRRATPGRTAGVRQRVGVGIYGFDRGDAVLSEESVRGDGFLADVVADWEAATAPAAEAGLAGGHRAHRDRAVRARWHAAADAAAVRRRPRRPAGQWQAVAVVDRRSTICSTSTTARCTTTGWPVPSTPWRPHPVRNADYTRTLGAGTAPTCRCCRCRRSDRDCCWGSRAPANSPRPTSGWCRAKLAVAGAPVPAPVRRRRAGSRAGARLTDHARSRSRAPNRRTRVGRAVREFVVWPNAIRRS